MDCSPPGSPVHGILQARILECVTIPFTRVSSRPRDRTQVSRITGRVFTIWATREAHFASRQVLWLDEFLEVGVSGSKGACVCDSERWCGLDEISDDKQDRTTVEDAAASLDVLISSLGFVTGSQGCGGNSSFRRWEVGLRVCRVPADLEHGSVSLRITG